MWQFKGNLFPHVIDVSLPNRVNLLSSGESGTGKSALGRILCSACNREGIHALYVNYENYESLCDLMSGWDIEGCLLVMDNAELYIDNCVHVAETCKCYCIIISRVVPESMLRSPGLKFTIDEKRIWVGGEISAAV